MVERNYRKDLRAWRGALREYDAQSREIDSVLTAKYGEDWFDKLSSNVAAGGGAVPALPPTPYTPEQLQAQREQNLAAIQQEVNSLDGGVLDDVYGGAKGVVRTAFNALDAPLQMTQNQVVSDIRETIELVKDPSWEQSRELLSTVIAPINQMKDPQVFTNTTLFSQMGKAMEGGVEAGFGAEGNGDGFFTAENSPVGEEKDRRAYEFAPLTNDGKQYAASIGRYAATGLGVSLESNLGKGLSGTVDAASVMLDPLNLIPGKAAVSGVRVAKGVSELRGAGVALEEVASAAKAVDRIGKAAASSDEATRAFKEAAAARSRVRVLNRNIDLVGKNRRRFDDPELREAARQIRDETRVVTEHAGDVSEFQDASRVLDEALREHARLIDDATMTEIELRNAAARSERQAAKSADDAAEQAADDTVEQVAQEMDVDEADLRRAYADYLVQQEGMAAREAEALAEYEAKAQKLTDVLSSGGARIGRDDTPDGVFQMVSALNGVGDNGVHLSRFFDGVKLGDFDGVARMAARTQSPSELRDMLPGVGADTIRRLSRSQDEHEALFVLMDGLLKGEVEKLPKALQRGVSENAFKNGTAGRRVARTLRQNTPTTRDVSADDADAMVDLVDDYIGYVGAAAVKRNGKFEEWEAFRSNYVSRMLDADTPEARKRVWLESQDELFQRIPGWEQLETSVQDAFLKKLGRMRQDDRGTAARSAFARAQLNDPNSEYTSLIYSLADNPGEARYAQETLITSLVDINSRIHAMDPDTLRKLIKSVGKAGDLSAQGKVTEAGIVMSDAFDKYLRPMMLAFRPGYVMLQFADTGSRSLLMGNTNMFSSPLQTMGVAAYLSHKPDGFLSKTFRRFADTPLNADGTPMFGVLQDETADMVARGMNESAMLRHMNRSSFRDFALNQSGRSYIDLGWKEVARELDESGKLPHKFVDAWADDLMMHMAWAEDGDTMFRHVLGVVKGELTEDVLKWARKTKRTNESLPDIVTDYYFYGPGKDEMYKLADSARRSPSDTPVMETILKDREKVYRFLFGQDEAGSKLNEVLALTGGGDPVVIEAAEVLSSSRGQYQRLLALMPEHKRTRAQADRKVIPIVGGKPSFVRTVTIGGEEFTIDFAKESGMKKVLRAKLRKAETQPPVVRTRETASTELNKSGLAQAEEFVDRSSDWFFGAAGRAEKVLSQAPWYRDEVLYQSAMRSSFLKRSDAEKLLRNIEGQIPKFKRTKRQREAVDLVQKAIRFGGGDGSYTLADVTDAAHIAAGKHAERTLYGMRGRNAAAKRFVLFGPFIQSWANATRVYAREIARRPYRAMNAMRAYDALTQEGSGVLNALPGGSGDTSKPFIWSDQYGRRMVSVPMAGYPVYLVDVIASGGPEGVTRTPHANLNVAKWNPLNFGEPLPGLGPAVTFPAYFVADDLPPQVNQYLFPVRGVNPDQDPGLVGSLAPWMVGLAFPRDAEIEAEVPSAVAGAIATYPEIYNPDGGFIDEGELAKITAVSQELAKDQVRRRKARSASFRGGVGDPDVVRANDGELVPLDVVNAQFRELLDKEGMTSAQAYAVLFDTYGVSGIAALVGKYDSAPVGNENAARFAADNEETFNKTASILGYFFPTTNGDGVEDFTLRSKSYQRMLSGIGKSKLRTQAEVAAQINNALNDMQKERLREKLGKGEITDAEYKAQLKANAAEYQLAVQKGFNASFEDKTWDQIDVALANEELRSTPVGQALSAYKAQRDAVYAQVKSQYGESATLDRKDAAGYRAYLNRTGQDLATAYPQFAPMWDRVLKWEVDEENG